jgi:ABC-type polysaccharide/polyol phosphate export permease
VLAQVLFYATPVIYPIEIVDEKYRDLMLLNPLAVIFEQIRVWVLDPAAPSAIDIAGGVLHLLPSVGIFVATCVFAVWIFNRDAPRIAEDL